MWQTLHINFKLQKLLFHKTIFAVLCLNCVWKVSKLKQGTGYKNVMKTWKFHSGKVAHFLRTGKTPFVIVTIDSNGANWRGLSSRAMWWTMRTWNDNGRVWSLEFLVFNIFFSFLGIILAIPSQQVYSGFPNFSPISLKMFKNVKYKFFFPPFF